VNGLRIMCAKSSMPYQASSCSTSTVFIGSNDMTQYARLGPGLGIVASQFDERDPAVRPCRRGHPEPAARLESASASAGRPVDHPTWRWLMEQGIDAISLNPDTVVGAWMPPCGLRRERAAAA
jgi:pyruvate,water dikinase